MTEGEVCLTFFLLLELDVRVPPSCIIYGNEGQALVDLWLLLIKCGKLMTWGLRQGKADYSLDL
jgi:hypothetical protein